MKKTILVTFGLIIFLTCCSVPDQPPPSPDFEKSIRFGGYEINGDEQWDGEKTDTPLTNAIEDHLLKKYGIHFTVIQYVYYDELSLCAEFSAYPENDPSIIFNLYPASGDAPLKLEWDHYPFELNRKKLTDCIYNAVSDFDIDRNKFTLRTVFDITPNTEINNEFFNDKEFTVAIQLPDIESKNALFDQRTEFCRQLCEKLEPKEFTVFVKTDDDIKTHSFICWYNSNGQRIVTCWIDDIFYEEIL